MADVLAAEGDQDSFDTSNSSEYSEDDIQVLEGLEAVRKRPGMYIGDTTLRGLHHLIYEIVANSVDEALAGRCDTIDVVIRSSEFLQLKSFTQCFTQAVNSAAELTAFRAVCTA